MRASTKIPAGNIEEKVRYWHRLLLDLEEKRAEMLRENQERELELQEFDSGKTSNFTVIVAGVMFGVCTLGGIFISAFSRNAGIGPFFAGLGFGVVSAVIVFARDAVESAEIEKHPPSPPHVDTERIDTAIREAHERLEYWERFKTAPQVQATVPVLNPAVSKVYPEEDFYDHPFGPDVVPSGTIAEKIQAWTDIRRELEDERTAIATEFTNRADQSDRYQFPRGYSRSILLAISCAIGLAIMGVLYVDTLRPLDLGDYAVVGAIVLIVVGFFSFEHSANTKAIQYYREFPPEGKAVDAAIDRANARLAYWERQAAKPPPTPEALAAAADRAAALEALRHEERLDHPYLWDRDTPEQDQEPKSDPDKAAWGWVKLVVSIIFITIVELSKCSGGGLSNKRFSNNPQPPYTNHYRP